MPRIRQVAACREQLLLGIQHIEVDALATGHAFLRRRHQGGGRADRHFIRPHFGRAAGVEVELLAQFDQRPGGLRVQFILGLGQLIGGLTG